MDTATNAPAPVTQEGPFGVSEAIEAITTEAIAQTVSAEPAEPAAEQQPIVPRETPTEPELQLPDGYTVDERGLVHRGDGSFAAAEEIPQGWKPPARESAAPAGESSAEPAAEVELPALPEGFVALPTVKDRELATAFTIAVGEKEIPVPDATVTFTANGQVRTEPLDKVVKLAQWGYYNQEREEQVRTTREQAESIAQQYEEIRQYALELEAERERLLIDEAAYLDARDQYEEQNTPEARLERQRAELEEDRAAQQYQQVAQHGAQYFQGQVQPAIERLAAALPSVSPEELAAKTLLVMDRFRVDTPIGRIVPPQQYQAVEQAILHEIVPWAAQLHEHRSAGSRRPPQQPRANVSAQAEAQRQRNLGARATTPPKAAAPGAKQEPQRQTTQPATVDDASESAIADALASVGVGS
jgi:hypothetical protein